MANKKSTRGVKTYKPHSGTTFFYGLFGLVVVGLVALTLFLPAFTLQQEDGSKYSYTGLEFLMYSFQNLVSKFALTKFGYLDENYVGAVSSNEMLNFVIKYHGFIQYAISGLYLIAVLFAVFTFFSAFIWIFGGKSNHPKALNNFVWTIFWFYGLTAGFLFLYVFFYKQMLEAIASGARIRFAIQVPILVGAFFVVCSIIGIMHTGCFKDRIPLNKKHEEVTISDSAEVKVESPAMPSEVITVGDRAYAKNTELTSANIPEKIVTLGSSAFANCVNLESVYLPSTLQDIGFNCFFNTPKLKRIVYNGTIEKWKEINRGSNWLTKSGTRVVQCSNGSITVNPHH